MKVTVDGSTHTIDIGNDSITVDGTAFKVKREGNGSLLTVLVDGRPYKVDLSGGQDSIIVDGKAYRVMLEGKVQATRQPTSAPRLLPKSPAAGGIKALMPGKITAVKVKVGDTVAAGTVLVILEAMKMENEIRTQVGGTVKSIPVTVGSNVDKGDTLAVVE